MLKHRTITNLYNSTLAPTTPKGSETLGNWRYQSFRTQGIQCVNWKQKTSFQNFSLWSPVSKGFRFSLWANAMKLSHNFRPFLLLCKVAHSLALVSFSRPKVSSVFFDCIWISSAPSYFRAGFLSKKVDIKSNLASLHRVNDCTINQSLMNSLIMYKLVTDVWQM